MSKDDNYIKFNLAICAEIDRGFEAIGMVLDKETGDYIMPNAPQKPTRKVKRKGKK